MREGWVANVFRASEFELARQLDHIGKPPDFNEWWMTPPSADAYHNSSQNSINMPAGFLAPPFYDRWEDDGVDFGGFGAGAGHGLIHGYDTLGRRYDAAGNLRDWWTPEDAKRFDERTKCVSDQYSKYIAIDDLHIDGELTVPEDLADAGGLRIALMALRKNMKQKANSSKKHYGVHR
jgi:putative endopeptidase